MLPTSSPRVILIKIQIFSGLLASLLLVQFLLVMNANLFVAFSTNKNPNPLAIIIHDGSVTLVLHVLIGAILFVLSLLVPAAALFLTADR